MSVLLQKELCDCREREWRGEERAVGTLNSELSEPMRDGVNNAGRSDD